MARKSPGATPRDGGGTAFIPPYVYKLCSFNFKTTLFSCDLFDRL